MSSESSFRGDRFFLSNFYEAPIVYDGIRYGSSEAAYQAQKCPSEEDRRRFSGLSPSDAKELGGSLTPREGWDSEKVGVMTSVVREKFQQHPDLAAMLLATGDEPLVERNSWGDRFWGTDLDGAGENMLGKILMRVRDELAKARSRIMIELRVHRAWIGDRIAARSCPCTLSASTPCSRSTIYLHPFPC